MGLSVDEVLNRGIKAQKSGKINDADRFYTAILKLHPTHPDTNYRMGLLAVDIGKFQESLAFFKSAIQADPTISKFWFSYIESLIKLKRMDDAREVYKSAKDQGLRGKYFLKIAKMLATNQTPDFDLSKSELLEKASLLKDVGMPNEAADFLEEFSDKLLDDPEVLCAIACCRIFNDEISQASEFLEKAKQINSGLACIKWNETRLLLKGRKIVDALDFAKEANILFPNDVEGLIILGNCFRLNKDLAAGLNCINQAIKLDARNAEAIFCRSLIQLELGKKTLALEDLQASHNINPYLKQIWKPLLNLNIEFKKYDETKRISNFMLSIDPDDETVTATIALCFQHQKNFHEAVLFYNKALNLNRTYVEAWINLGSALQELNKLDESANAYKQAIMLSPRNIDAQYNMGNLLYLKKDYEGAVETFKQIITQNSMHDKAYNNMANALIDQGNIEEGITAYQHALRIDPAKKSVVLNLLSLRIQLFCDDLNLRNIDLNHNIESSVYAKMPKACILQSIGFFLKGNITLARECIAAFEACAHEFLDNLSKTDQKFCLAYFRFLKGLIKEFSNYEIDKKTDNVIFHLGDSHCLSYAHRKLIFDGSIYRVEPRIIFGAKAFHLGSLENNKYKGIFSRHFKTINDHSKVFLSFGEIDCRATEGFIATSKKYDKPIEMLILDTVTRYLGWINRLNTSKKHELFFLNIPAPKYQENNSPEANTMVKNTVKKFNEILAVQLKKDKHVLVDVYAFTVGENEFSNCTYHLDNVHLSSNAISQIEKQLLRVV